MASWAPGPEDVHAESSGRTHLPADVTKAITSAVVDVISEVGSFDHTAVIVEADGADPAITLGDLAGLAAAARAAHLLEGGFPEQNPYGEPNGSQAGRLYARWRDRVERLGRWIASSTETPQDPPLFSGSVGLNLPVHYLDGTIP